MSQEARWLENLFKKPPQILSEEALRIVCERVKELLLEENNVQHVSAPVTICGDIHGQFYDLRELFNVGGQLPHTNYIFLGDYVDRGYNSLETFQYLMLLKLLYPSHITLLRGNHESRQISQVYGFYDECLRRYGNASAWRMCTDVFDFLTIAALVDGSVFCIHGGVSPSVKYVDQIRLINRFQEAPHSGPFGDILWSDPENIEGWAVNPRGAGWLFGRRIVEEFNYLNDIDLIARAHQLAMEGYQFIFGSDSSLVTVWSAPNYCYRCGNVAAILQLNSDMSKRFLTFHDTSESRQTMVSRITAPYFL